MNKILAVILTLSLAACATATPYQPTTKGLGYSEQKLESNRYRVSFSGSSATPRDRVDSYLMYRAAEVTLQNGYDYFVIGQQDSGAAPRQSGSGSSSVGFGFGTGSYGSGVSLGIGTILGGGDEEQYNAAADVLVFKGRKPAGDPNAFDAREIKASLEPLIQRPATKAP